MESPPGSSPAGLLGVPEAQEALPPSCAHSCPTGDQPCSDSEPYPSPSQPEWDPRGAETDAEPQVPAAQQNTFIELAHNAVWGQDTRGRLTDTGPWGGGCRGRKPFCVWTWGACAPAGESGRQVGKAQKATTPSQRAACSGQSEEGWALSTPVWPTAPFHASLVPGTQDPSPGASALLGIQRRRRNK